MRALRHFLMLLSLVALPAWAQSATATLTWSAPTANVNGSAISGTITYNVYQGAQGAALAKVQSGITTTAATVTTGLTPGVASCFAVTAVVNSIESAQSATACATPAFPTPGSPTQIIVVIH